MDALFTFLFPIPLKHYEKRCLRLHIKLNYVLTHLFFHFVLGSMYVGQRVRAQDRAHRGGPLHCYQPVLPEQNVSDVARSGNTHRGVPKEVRAVDVAVLLALHAQKFPSLSKLTK